MHRAIAGVSTASENYRSNVGVLATSEKHNYRAIVGLSTASENYKPNVGVDNP